MSVPEFYLGEIYGIDWDFGDKVTLRYAGLEFFGDVRSVTVSIDSNGLETVRASVEVDLVFG